MKEKQLSVSVWYIGETQSYCAKIGSCLFAIKKVSAMSLKEKEDIDIIYVEKLEDVK